ncbi:glycosidase [Sphingomonas sp. LY160]|uniref:glycoside hydrolase family 130 protein n=1 Tax=Sphingomonas sp. LY160 TaxID=3095342 RepID=UPI002ADEE41F|nr:glycosidase [Sphingomonas sp. LY160]MEA1072855.1 glycosidase [Sphingomonas sp. LY160]
MTDLPGDRLILTSDDIDLSRSPLAADLGGQTYVLGAFNPGLTRLPNGNLLLMVRIAEALREPVRDGHVHAIRWDQGRYRLDRWPCSAVDLTDPRTFRLRDQPSPVAGLTSLSWLLPVELSANAEEIVRIDYDAAITPCSPVQCYGLEDPRISRIGETWWMTVCSVSPERQATSLYRSDNAREWTFEGLVLDHQNKDMLLFEGVIDGRYWAQTRPLGDVYFAYPPESEWQSGPSINLASSPDALHWKPCIEPGIRPHSATVATARMGGGAPPIRTRDGWLSLWHGVEPNDSAGVYRTYWSMLDADRPWQVVRTDHHALIEADPALTRGLEDKMYLSDIVFTTGIVDEGDHFLIASGEADLACRLSRVAYSRFGL